MRVLMLTEFFPHSDLVEITGGVEARCYYVAKNLGAQASVVVIAQRTDGGTWEWASAASLPRRLRFLWRAFAEGLAADVDVVEGTNHVVDPVAWLIGLLKRRPVVIYHPDVMIGSWVRDFGLIGLLGEAVERVVLRLPVARYITTSQAVIDKMVAHGVNRKRIALIPCGYERALTEEIRASVTDKQYDVCIVNRLVAYKHVDIAIEAVAGLARAGLQLRVAVIGQGPELDRLRQLARNLGIGDRVDFVGFVPAHTEVLRLIARSRIFVSASTVEGFGIVLAEAMGLGIPYVVTDIDVFREISDNGRGGLLFRALDVSDLSRCMKLLLTDQDLHSASSAAAMHQGARYTWEEIAQRTAEVWRQAAHGPEYRALQPETGERRESAGRR
ncbi:MAG: glycosyltransferase family 4 protein [Candidatus Dormibacteria bacterium]